MLWRVRCDSASTAVNPSPLHFSLPRAAIAAPFAEPVSCSAGCGAGDTVSADLSGPFYKVLNPGGAAIYGTGT